MSFADTIKALIGNDTEYNLSMYELADADAKAYADAGGDIELSDLPSSTFNIDGTLKKIMDGHDVEQFGRKGSPYSPYLGSANTSRTWNYLNADLAKAYNMSKSTAYQEALANTAHQREVVDLKAAGLNPVLSANGGNGAAVFAGAPDAVSSGFGSAAKKTSGKGLYGSIFQLGLTCAGQPAIGKAVKDLFNVLDM